jgi:hypothetical protein
MMRFSTLYQKSRNCASQSTASASQLEDTRLKVLGKPFQQVIGNINLDSQARCNLDSQARR